MGERLTIINIARSQATSEQLTSIIDDQMQFEAIEPVHTAFAPCRFFGKNAVAVDAAIVADRNGCRVDETDACAITITLLEINAQW
jgi:hypothetical protein